LSSAFAVNSDSPCAYPAVLQDIQALLQRLQQPTAAKVAAEHDNIGRFKTIMLSRSSGPASQLPLAPIPSQQMSTLVQQWCRMIKLLLSVLKDDPAAVKEHPMSLFSTGTLLSLLANCLEWWAQQAPIASAAAEAAMRQQILQHTSGEVLSTNTSPDGVNISRCEYIKGLRI
jgi:hypothetical protein